MKFFRSSVICLFIVNPLLFGADGRALLLQEEVKRNSSSITCCKRATFGLLLVTAAITAGAIFYSTSHPKPIPAPFNVLPNPDSSGARTFAIEATKCHAKGCKTYPIHATCSLFNSTSPEIYGACPASVTLKFHLETEDHTRPCRSNAQIKDVLPKFCKAMPGPQETHSVRTPLALSLRAKITALQKNRASKK